jgi:hypothetical protein
VCDKSKVLDEPICDWGAFPATAADFDDLFKTGGSFTDYSSAAPNDDFALPGRTVLDGMNAAFDRVVSGYTLFQKSAGHKRSR